MRIPAFAGSPRISETSGDIEASIGYQTRAIKSGEQGHGLKPSRKTYISLFETRHGLGLTLWGKGDLGKAHELFETNSHSVEKLDERHGAQALSLKVKRILILQHFITIRPLQETIALSRTGRPTPLLSLVWLLRSMIRNRPGNGRNLPPRRFIGMLPSRMPLCLAMPFTSGALCVLCTASLRSIVDRACRKNLGVLLKGWSRWRMSSSRPIPPSLPRTSRLARGTTNVQGMGCGPRIGHASKRTTNWHWKPQKALALDPSHATAHQKVSELQRRLSEFHGGKR